MYDLEKTVPQMKKTGEKSGLYFYLWLIFVAVNMIQIVIWSCLDLHNNMIRRYTHNHQPHDNNTIF